MEHNLGNRLQRLRGKESRAAFAKRFDVSESSLVRWERGDNLPDLEFVSKIIKEYGVNFDWIMHGTGEAAVASEVLESLDSQPTNKTARPKNVTELTQSVGRAARRQRHIFESGDSSEIVSVSMPVAVVQEMAHTSLRQSQRLDEVDQERWRLKEDKEKLLTQVSELLRDLEDKEAEISRLNQKVLDLTGNNVDLHNLLQGKKK